MASESRRRSTWSATPSLAALRARPFPVAEVRGRLRQLKAASARQVFRGAKTDRAQLCRALAIMIPCPTRILCRRQNRSEGWPDA
jgi:hypothetical protein